MIRRLLPAITLFLALTLPVSVFAASPADEAVFGDDLVWEVALNVIAILAMAGLAAIVAMLWPAHLAVIGRSITSNPVMAGAAGLLVVGVVVPVLAAAVLTLILIPLSLAGLLVLGAVGVFGWIALSLEAGKRIGRAAGREWSPAAAAGIGAFLLGLLFLGIERIPCVGWMIQAAIGLVGLGAVVLSKFGTEPDLALAVPEERL